VAVLALLALLSALLTGSTPAVSATGAAVNVTRHDTQLTGGDAIFSLPGTPVQKKQEPKPHSFVENGTAYFGDDGAVLNVNFATMTGTKYTGWGKVVAEFDGARPTITITGDTSNMDVSQEKKEDGLPFLNVSFHNPEGNYGFLVYFSPDTEFMGGKFAYPQFYSMDYRALGSPCSVTTSTTNIRASGGGGIRWNSFRATGQMGNMSAFYTASSPEVFVQSGDNRIEEFGFQFGEPYAVTDYVGGWFEVGFDKQDLIHFGSQYGTAKC